MKPFWLRPDDSLSSHPSLCPTICFRSFFVALSSPLLILHPPFLLCLSNSPIFRSDGSLSAPLPSLPLPSFPSVTLLLLFLLSSSCTLLCLLCPLSFCSPLSQHSVLPVLLSFYLCIFSSALLHSLFACAVITTHSFNPLLLQSGEVEVMGDFCLKLSAQLLNSGNKQYLSCLCFLFPTRPSPISWPELYEAWGCPGFDGR